MTHNKQGHDGVTFTAFWGYLLKCIGILPYPNVDTMMASVDRAWENMKPAYIQKTCAAFPRRLKKVVAAAGGVIEK